MPDQGRAGFHFGVCVFGSHNATAQVGAIPACLDHLWLAINTSTEDDDAG